MSTATHPQDASPSQDIAHVPSLGEPGGEGEFTPSHRTARASKKRPLWFALIATIVAAAVVSVVAMQGGFGGQDPPPGFPSQNELPLVAGQVQPVASPTEDTVQSAVVIAVPDETAQQEALTLLEERGYREVGRSGSGPVGTVVSYVSDTHSVRVELNVTSEGEYVVHYVTSPRTALQK